MAIIRGAQPRRRPCPAGAAIRSDRLGNRIQSTEGETVHQQVQTEDCQEARLAPPDRSRSNARHSLWRRRQQQIEINPKSAAEALRSAVDHAT
jgi:hypothetical protein